MTPQKLEKLYREILEEKIIAFLAKEKCISFRKSMEIYYKSRLSEQIYIGAYGIDNLDPKYLVEDLIENEPDLFAHT